MSTIAMQRVRERQEGVAGPLDDARQRAAAGVRGRLVAFVCRTCGQAVGDAMYRGPAGHAPAEVCLECWLAAFERPPWHWPRQVLAVWLIANGFSRTEAAARCGVADRTVRRWLVAFRGDPEAFLDFVSGLEGLGTLRRLRGGVVAR